MSRHLSTIQETPQITVDVPFCKDATLILRKLNSNNQKQKKYI